MALVIFVIINVFHLMVMDVASQGNSKTRNEPLTNYRGTSNTFNFFANSNNEKSVGEKGKINDCCCRCKNETANGSDSIPEEQKLMYHLLHGYETAVRPVKNSSSPVRTMMGITLTQIFDMDEKNQVLVTNVWLDQAWNDEYLVWDPTEFSGLKSIRLPPNKIWRPDLVLYNNAADFADNQMPALAMIENTGRVFWPVPTKLRSSCKVDVTYFPFDEQVCHLKFGSWTYDGFQVDLTLLKDKVDLKTYVANGEWELTNQLALRNNIVYPCCSQPYPDVTFYLFLRRRILYYMYHVIYPCIMMSSLTLLVFCLPPDSGEKIALGITVLLAFSVLMLSIAEKLPETSESVPIISIYLTVVMSMTSVSVIMTVFVLNLHHRNQNKKEVPNWLKCIVFGRKFNEANSLSADLLPTSEFIRNLSLKLTIESLCKDLRENDTTMEANTKNTQGQEGHLNSVPTFVASDHRRATVTQSLLRSSSLSNQQQQASSTSDAFKQNHFKTNKEILNALKKIIAKHDADDGDAQLVSDWRKVAQFVDKVLFWVYMVCTLASTFIILVIAPVFKIIPYDNLYPVARDDTKNKSYEFWLKAFNST